MDGNGGRWIERLCQYQNQEQAGEILSVSAKGIEMVLSEDLRNSIKRKRKELKLNQSETAQRAGCSLATVWRIENGSCEVDENHIKNICRTLGLRWERKEVIIAA